jgi:dienelactone hydrolase
MKDDFFGRVASRLGGVVDEAFLSALSFRFQRRRPGARAPHAPERVDRRALLTEAIAFYRRPEVLSGAQFFVAPPVPRMIEARRGPLDDGERVDLKWASAFEPRWPAMAADYLSWAPNRFAYARLFRHRRPRGTIICLHGYRSGHFFVEERAFSARWLYGLGLDVALFVLPFHARRGGARGDGAAPVWPSVNVARTNEGFAQAVFDLRALIGWLRQNAAPVAVCGMSLGGYTTALLATVEPLEFAAPMIPVASFPDLLWAHGEGRPERARAEREGITLPMLQAAMEVHSPLQRAPLVPPERVLVVSAQGDRIAPPEHATRLARHFGAEELRFRGGHLLQLGRGDAFRAIARRLSALGLISR